MILRLPRAWTALSPELKRLWGVAGGLFLAGNVFKYVTWLNVQEQVEQTSKAAHEDASRQLIQARETAQKYALPPIVRR